MARLLSIATKNPEHNATQDVTGRFMRKVAAAVMNVDEENEMLGKLERFYQKSGINRRYGVIDDYGKEDPEEFTFYGKSWNLEPFPSTNDRMKLYEKYSVPLAVAASRDALDQAGIKPEQVTHLIFTTCTGFFAPGPDVLVARELGLRSDVQRLQIGFMGCYAGFNGMRQAAGMTAYDPNAVVLQICLELCSLHYQKEADLNSIVANCLFADGCSAAIWAGDTYPGKALAQLGHSTCNVDGDSLDGMTWHIGDFGYKMGLSADVPKTIERGLPDFVDNLLKEDERDSVDFWAVHPGGRAIVDAAESSLGLEPSQLDIPRSVLADYGNMSSATIFFVLSRVFAQAQAGDKVLALGFGPGLTLEGAVLTAE